MVEIERDCHLERRGKVKMAARGRVGGGPSGGVSAPRGVGRQGRGRG